MLYKIETIANELDRTASGAAYYGNALCAALDFQCLNDDDRAVLKAYLDGA